MPSPSTQEQFLLRTPEASPTAMHEMVRPSQKSLDVIMTFSTSSMEIPASQSAAFTASQAMSAKLCVT